MSIGNGLFSFSGRASRGDWWAAQLGCFFALGILKAIFEGVHRDAGASTLSTVVGVAFYCVLAPPIVWLMLATTVKRLHDRNKSGAWVLAFCIPGVGPLWAIIELGLMEGTYGTNQYDDNRA